MKREIEKWEGKEGFQRYLAWLSEAHAHYEISVTEVLHKNFSSILSFFDWNLLRNLRELHAFESIYSRASRYFYTERLRRVFTFGSMYMGMSPFDAPGTYSLLQYTELAEGIWYPVGGFHAVVAALVKVGERLGVKYRLNTPVSSVSVSSDGKIATGVVLESGEMLSADIVVVNADLVYAYNNLFPSPQSFSVTKSPLYPLPRSPAPRLMQSLCQDELAPAHPSPFTGRYRRRSPNWKRTTYSWQIRTRSPSTQFSSDNPSLTSHLSTSTFHPALTHPPPLPTVTLSSCWYP